MASQIPGVKDAIGSPVTNLPTPSLIIQRHILEQNISKLHRDVSKLGIDFRPHVKTLKSLEVTRLMLGNGKYRKIVASTIPEIEGLLPLVAEGLLDECLYGLPVYPGILSRLSKLNQQVKIAVMVDNAVHIDILENFSRNNPSTAIREWSVFIKIDVGSQRAGVPSDASRLRDLVWKAENSDIVNINGFYAHAGHSYSCRSTEEAQDVLQAEAEGVLRAAALLSCPQHVVVSIGSTPTAHVVEHLKACLPGNISLELHAGNFPVNDLQQVSTGLVDFSQQATRVMAEVCSVYPERNEALVNAGVLSLSREKSAHPGFGAVASKPGWAILRLSQEHGIIGALDKEKCSKELYQMVENTFKVGEKVFLFCQHACITAAGYPAYYVVDERDIVVDVWKPWKYW